jgi:hypothetical protein
LSNIISQSSDILKEPKQIMALNVNRSGVCRSAGFVLVKKVPGTLHLLAKSPGHSFDFVAMNMSHVVHQWFFGNKPSPRRRSVSSLPCYPVTYACRTLRRTPQCNLPGMAGAVARAVLDQAAAIVNASS